MEINWIPGLPTTFGWYYINIFGEFLQIIFVDHDLKFYGVGEEKGYSFDKLSNVVEHYPVPIPRLTSSKENL